ncbi:type IV toxin-antitoxin system AbiEi family antitoxin domain-containing protein [Rhodococcus opacus]|uniref:type IV toxin-antitoxin system AbiEi family antitoxin domain-containing protein n=1 Tax=Rhodococcus opacus TaxID=37919 RepID=UPI000AC2EB6F|nr:type IV toxin-antitoxin system AbiEi family antitoxin domain-containing protein [Rhodococcus opacus]
MEYDPGAMLRRQEALDRGYSDDEIRRMYTRGDWHRISRGAYLSASTYAALGEEERHRFLIDSTVHAASDDAVLSHQSAAVIYGLPLWKTPSTACTSPETDAGVAGSSGGSRFTARPSESTWQWWTGIR